MNTCLRSNLHLDLRVRLDGLQPRKHPVCTHLVMLLFQAVTELPRSGDVTSLACCCISDEQDMDTLFCMHSFVIDTVVNDPVMHEGTMGIALCILLLKPLVG